MQFLSFCQANNYNVEIRNKEAGDLHVDTMEIKLLSRRRREEELKEFQAPSLLQ